MKRFLYDGRKATSLLEESSWESSSEWINIGNSIPMSSDVRRYYESVGLLYQCVHLRAKSLSKVPWTIENLAGDSVWKKGDPPPKDLVFASKLPRLMYKTEAALCLGSQAYLHKERNRSRVLDLKWLAPSTISPYWDIYDDLVRFDRRLGMDSTPLPPEDVVYIWYQHPLYEVLRDVSPVEAALNAAGVLYNIDLFAKGFFERGAIRAMILTVQGNPPKKEMDRIKSWWNRGVAGIRNVFQTEVVNADKLVPVPVGEGIRELENTTITAEKKEDIATTMGIPLSLLFSNAANYATSQQDEQNFYNQTIVPDCEIIGEFLNEQLFIDMGYQIIFSPNAMDIFATDETERSNAFAQYVGAGLPKSLVAEMLNLDLPDGWTYEDLDVEEEQQEGETPGVATSEDVESEESLEAEETQDETAAAERSIEVRRFKAWLRKRKTPDPTKFKSEILSETEKKGILFGLQVLDAEVPVDEVDDYPPYVEMQTIYKGGPGSGNFGHTGRVGSEGGSVGRGAGSGHAYLSQRGKDFEASHAPSWKPSMTRAEAEAWVKNSAVPGDTWHVTRSENAEGISQKGFTKGFDLSRKAFGRVWGDGVYVSDNPETSKMYEQWVTMGSDNPPSRLTLKVNVEKVFEYDMAAGNNIFSLPERIDTALGTNFRYESSSVTGGMIDALKANGYGAIRIKAPYPQDTSSGGDQVVVFDPKSVTVVVD